jgi:hypothetical protein
MAAQFLALGRYSFDHKIKQEDMAGYATLMAGTINAYKIFVGKHEEKKQLDMWRIILK